MRLSFSHCTLAFVLGSIAAGCGGGDSSSTTTGSTSTETTTSSSSSSSGTGGAGTSSSSSSGTGGEMSSSSSSGSGGAGGMTSSSSSSTSSSSGSGSCQSDTDCDDGDACTTDTCAMGACSHVPVKIDDSNACTIDACNEQTGQVTHTPVDVSDNDACTTDACDPQTGQITHTAINVSDNNPCTTDACNPQTGMITHTPVDVSDTDACTTDACDPQTGQITHTPVDVNDNDACTIDTCDPQTGMAVHTPVSTDDGVTCTVDACNAQTGVTHTPNDAACATNFACDAKLGCVPAPITGLVITEFLSLGSAGNGGELIEVYNSGAAAGNVAGLTITNGMGQVVTIHAPSDPMGTNKTPVFVPAGGYAYGVPNPQDAALIPGDAAFVYGDPGTTWQIADGGDVLTIRDAKSVVLDTVDFQTALAGNVPAFTSDPSKPVLAGQFPGFPMVSTQLDPAFLTASGNDSGDHWCITFRAPDTAGQPNGSCGAFVINEVLYDYAHPILGSGDDGNTFIELAGPGGGVLAGHKLQGTNATGTTVAQPSVTFAAGTRVPVDGLFVVGDNISGSNPPATNVPNADLIAPCDPTNGDSGNLVRLQSPQGTIIDVVGYGPGAVGEGTPVDDLDPNKVAISIARDQNSTDTNDNKADFHFDPTPTPGLPNLPVVPKIVSRAPVDGLATGATQVTLVVTDFFNLRGFATAALAGNDVVATFAGNPSVATDTGTQNEGCQITDITNAGRGDATIVCTAPTNAGTVKRGDFVLANPAAIAGSGSITVTNGWTYTGVNNETNLASEVDYCVLQFPATLTAQSGQTSPLVYGRIYEAGVTDPAGAGANILAQLGYGVLGSNPTTQSGWIFGNASFNMQFGNDDEYQASILGPKVPVVTHFAYTYRFSFDGGLTFTYCDLDGAGSNAGFTFAANQLGDLTVNP